MRLARPSRYRRRRGYVLILFALFAFGLFALAALVIDMGFVRLSQRQMQTAVDGAALEGLRNGREEANKLVVYVFDDDLDAANGDPRNFGAGPILNFEGGVGDPTFAASQLISVPTSHVYKPMQSNGEPGIETNELNDADGDMVKGVSPDGQPTFTTRMKRSRESPVPGISTSGPPVPLLFGRGSLIQLSTPGDYSPLQHGITVRATAIAQATRVKSVGKSIGAGKAELPDGLAGALPLVIMRSSWEGDLSSVTVNIDGTLMGASGTIGHVTNKDGIGEVTSLGQVCESSTEKDPPLIIEDMDGFATALMDNLPTSRAGYVPIIAEPTDGNIANRVIGIACVELADINVTPDGTTVTFRLTKQTDKIATENASAILAKAIAPPLSDVDFDLLWQLHNSLPYSLLTPALVR